MRNQAELESSTSMWYMRARDCIAGDTMRDEQGYRLLDAKTWKNSTDVIEHEGRRAEVSFFLYGYVDRISLTLIFDCKKAHPSNDFVFTQFASNWSGKESKTLSSCV